MKSEQVGARVKEMRKALGMKQDELSSILGIGKSALSMIETGRAALSERNKNILIQELNLNPQWIESGEGRFSTARWKRSSLSSGVRTGRCPCRAYLYIISKARQDLSRSSRDKPPSARWITSIFPTCPSATGPSTSSETACTPCSKAETSYCTKR